MYNAFKVQPFFPIYFLRDLITFSTRNSKDSTLKVSKFDLRLDPRKFRESRIESGGARIEMRGTVKFSAPLRVINYV